MPPKHPQEDDDPRPDDIYERFAWERRREARRQGKSPSPKRARTHLKVAPEPTPPPVAPPAIVKPAIAEKPIEQPAMAEPQPVLWQGIIAGDKWLGVPLDLLDKVMRGLELADQSVLLRLYRLSWGFKVDTCTVSHDALAKGCNISRRQAQISTLRLAEKGLIKILPKAKPTDPSRYKVMVPPAVGREVKEAAKARSAMAASATIKEGTKETTTLKNEMTPEEVEAARLEYEAAMKELEGK